MQIKAVNNRVLVECPEIEEDTNEKGYTTEIALASGRQIVEGTVVTADPNTDLKPNDTIYFPRYAANEFNYKGSLLFSLDFDDVEYIVSE